MVTELLIFNMDDTKRDLERTALSDDSLRAQIQLAINNSRLATSATSNLIVIRSGETSLANEFKFVGSLAIQKITPEYPYLSGRLTIPINTAWECFNLEYHCLDSNPNVFLSLVDIETEESYAGIIVDKSGTHRSNNFGRQIGKIINPLEKAMSLKLKLEYLETPIQIAACANLQQMYSDPTLSW